MKKFASLLLAVLMVMSLAACGGTGSQDTPAPAADTPAANTGNQGNEPAPAPGNDKLVVGFAQIGQESGWRNAETNDI